MVDGIDMKSPIEQAEERINRDGPAALPVTLESVIATNDPGVPFEAEGKALEIRHPSTSNTKDLLPRAMAVENNNQVPEASAGEFGHSKTTTSPGGSTSPNANGSGEDRVNEVEDQQKADGNEPQNIAPSSPVITTEYSRTEPMQYENPGANQGQILAEHQPEHHGTCRHRCIRVWEVVKRPGPREMREVWEVETIWATWLL